MKRQNIYILPPPPYFMERAREKGINMADFYILTILKQVGQENRNAIFISNRMERDYSSTCKRISFLKLKGYVREIKNKNKRVLTLTPDGIKYQEECNENLYGGGR